jgi:intracellular septation protein
MDARPGRPAARFFGVSRMTPIQVARPIVVDLLSAIAFAAVFFIAKKMLHMAELTSVYMATLAGIAIGVIQFVARKIMREPIGPLHWLSLGVVFSLGMVTIALHDEHFIKLKPTVIDLAVGVFMALDDWMTPYLPPEIRANVPRRTIFLAEKTWAAIMIAFAGVNVAVAFLFDFGIWVFYATFVPTTIIVILFFVQYAMFRRLAARNAQRNAVGAV